MNSQQPGEGYEQHVLLVIHLFVTFAFHFLKNCINQ